MLYSANPMSLLDREELKASSTNTGTRQARAGVDLAGFAGVMNFSC